ncbi:MAG: sigma-54-dependent Fis family transcriptional regulator, partial [Spirochaetales bacterium]
MLYNYNWPGNVRELRNCLESAVVMSKGPILTPDDLPPTIADDSESNYVRVPLGTSLSDAEREIIRANLSSHNGNKSRTAETLGIGRKTLHRKIAEYGL